MIAKRKGVDAAHTMHHQGKNRNDRPRVTELDTQLRPRCSNCKPLCVSMEVVWRR